MKGLKDFAPLAILLCGWAMSRPLDLFSPVIPYIITLMLFMTFLKVRPRDISFNRGQFYLLFVQLGLGAVAYGLGYLISPEVGAVLLLCFLSPSATAGPSIVRLLGGDVAYTTTYVLLSHLSFVVLAPCLFPYIGTTKEVTELLPLMWDIFYQVFRLIAPAVAVAWLLVYVAPRWAKKIGDYTSISYALWLLSVLLLMAHSTESFARYGAISLSKLLLISCLGLISCVLQYVLGHYLAPYLGYDRHSVRHSLGQKNTSLAIWISAIFLPPIVSIGITSYILWQNLAISFVLARYKSK